MAKRKKQPRIPTFEEFSAGVRDGTIVLLTDREAGTDDLTVLDVMAGVHVSDMKPLDPFMPFRELPPDDGPKIREWIPSRRR